MIYKHGAYEHDVHVVDWSIVPERNPSGAVLRTTHRAVLEGVVRGADQAAVKTAIDALESAYIDTVVTKTGLYHNDGTTESSHIINLSGATTENGINAIVQWISPVERAEYVLSRSFRIEVSATFLGAAAGELEYSNRIARIGNGGPIRVPRLTLGGVVIQTAYPASPYTGYESGRRISRLGTPLANSPSFPAILVNESRQVEYGVEQSAGVTSYFATWNYNYLSSAAF